MTFPLPRRRPFRFGVQAQRPPGRLRRRRPTTGPLACPRPTGRGPRLRHPHRRRPPRRPARARPRPGRPRPTPPPTLRIGALVFCNDYRHPVVLAKEAATLDVLCGGRLELGLGAGLDDAPTTTPPASPSTAPACASPGWPRPSTVIDGPAGPTGRAPSTGEHYRIDGLDGHARSRCSAPGPRCCSAAAAGGCSPSPAGTPTSSASTRRCAAGVIDAAAGPDATAAATEREDRLDRATPPATASPTSSCRPGSTSSSSPTTARRWPRLSPRPGPLARRALETPHALAGTVDEIAETSRAPGAVRASPTSASASTPLDAFAPVVERLAGT